MMFITSTALGIAKHHRQDLQVVSSMYVIHTETNGHLQIACYTIANTVVDYYTSYLLCLY